MKERPILFSAPMVRAILDGKKTQTRRIVKAPAKNMQRAGMQVIKHREPGDPWYRDHVWSMRDRMGVWGDYTDAQFRALCPYGGVGDRLWVRETWVKCSEGYLYRERGDRWAYAWRPSIFMPRDASRIDLEITNVRVERLQDIGEDDASAEGVDEFDGALDEHMIVKRAVEMGAMCEDSRPWFAAAWDHINGPGAWDSNPWVWVVAFRRLP
jgi:hypothetical protein